MHSAHLTSSPDSSILAGDVFFHFLPAACAGYPFWSCIPGCDHSKLHGKFSFHFNFPPGIAPLSRANTLFSFSFLRRGLTLSPLLCLVVVSRTWLILLSAAWTFSFFCLFGFFWGLLVLFYILFSETPVFVSHLLASSSHVLAVVLLWSLVSLCLLVTVYVKCWRFSGVQNPASLIQGLRYQLIRNKKVQHAWARGVRLSHDVRGRNMGKGNCVKSSNRARKSEHSWWAEVSSSDVLQPTDEE